MRQRVFLNASSRPTGEDWSRASLTTPAKGRELNEGFLMTARLAFFVFCSVALAVGCSSDPKVRYDCDVRTDFERLRTYDWLPIPVKAEVNELPHRKRMGYLWMWTLFYPLTLSLSRQGRGD